ncbi:hypothetical protein D3C81_1847370 [compost metagenome]
MTHSLALEAVTVSMLPSSMRSMQLSTNTRMIVAWVSTSASLKRMFCCSISGLPNALRSLVYSTVRRSARSIEAQAPTAQPTRS